MHGWTIIFKLETWSGPEKETWFGQPWVSSRILASLIWWLFLGGHNLDEGGLESLQAKIAETDGMIRHFESIIRARDQEATHPMRVSIASYKILPFLRIMRPWRKVSPWNR